jgi:polar amino acid transport system substrate-binding protein
MSDIRSIFFPSICMAICLLFPMTIKAETLRFTTIDYCPFTCDPAKENGREGIMTEVLRAALEEAGHKIEIKIFPYTRAVTAVSSGQYDGIIVTGKDLAPNLIYPDMPTATQKGVYSVKTGSTWKYEGIDSLAQTSIGIVKGYDYGSAELNNYVKEHADSDKVVLLCGLNTTERALKMLLDNRIGTYVDGEYSVQYSLQRDGLTDQVSIAGYASHPFDNYTGFSQHHPKAVQYAKRLSDKIKELKQSGELRKIINSYVISFERIPRTAKVVPQTAEESL